MVKTIGVVSLSSGMLGESFARHQLELGIKRLKAYGIKVKFMTNTLRGIAYLNEHPEARAADLIEAFQDPEVDLIMTAIGGDDTYRLLPYLFGSGELAAAVKGNEKLMEAVNAALDCARKSGELSEVSEKYFHVDVTEE